MSRIPGKLAHRKASTKDILLSLLVDREIGYCDADNTAYIRIGNELHSLGGGRIDKPTTTSLLMGFLEDAETYTYDWKSLEYLEPVPDNPLKLWSRLAGMGLYAEVAHMDSKGRDISEQLDYAGVLVAMFDETTYTTIAAAVSQGKSVILSLGNTQFAYLYSVFEDAYIFRSFLSGEHTYTEYTVGPDDIWNARTVDIGETTPTLDSNKLLTSGGAYAALKEKADAHNTTPGTFTKVSVNEQGVVTEGHSLDGSDIPEHSADTITSGHLNPDRLEDNSIPAEKLEIRKKLLIDGITMGATESLNDVVLHSIYTGDLNVLQLDDITYTPNSPSVQNLNITQGSAYNIYMDTSDRGVAIGLTLNTLSEYTIHTILKITALYPSPYYASLQLVWLDEMLQPHMVELQWGSELTEQTTYYLDVFIRRIGTNCVARVVVMPSDFRKNY